MAKRKQLIMQGKETHTHFRESVTIEKQKSYYQQDTIQPSTSCST